MVLDGRLVVVTGALVGISLTGGFLVVPNRCALVPKRLLGSLDFRLPKLPNVLELVVESWGNCPVSWREEARRRVRRGEEEDWRLAEGPGLYLLDIGSGSGSGSAIGEP